MPGKVLETQYEYAYLQGYCKLMNLQHRSVQLSHGRGRWFGSSIARSQNPLLVHDTA
jgi:hypothetical protein